MALEKIVCRVTGEEIDATDADALASHWEFLKAREDEIRASKQQVTLALMALAPPGHRTSRVLGKERVIRLEEQDDSWEQTILKDLYLSGGKWAKALLRLDKVAVNKIEYKKMLATGGDPELDDFLAHLKSAIRPNQSLPRITIEM